MLPIFHPAAAIYDRTKRDALFADFETLRDLLGRSSAEQDADAAQSTTEPGQTSLF